MPEVATIRPVMRLRVQILSTANASARVFNRAKTKKRAVASTVRSDAKRKSSSNGYNTYLSIQKKKCANVSMSELTSTWNAMPAKEKLHYRDLGVERSNVTEVCTRTSRQARRHRTKVIQHHLPMLYNDGSDVFHVEIGPRGAITTYVTPAFKAASMPNWNEVLATIKTKSKEKSARFESVVNVTTGSAAFRATIESTEHTNLFELDGPEDSNSVTYTPVDVL
jgi:hypothetical protein